MGPLVWVLIVSALVTNDLVFGGRVYDDAYDQLGKELEGYLLATMENLRSEMPTGIPALKMPPLDPLKLNEVNFNHNQDSVNIGLKLQDVRLKGLSSFTIRTLRPDLLNLKLKVDLSLSKIAVNGNYDLNGKFLNLFPVYGKGPFTITLFNPTMKGSANLVLAGEDMIVEKMDLNFDWSNMDANLENLLGGGSLGALISKVIPIVGKQAFNHFRPDIMTQVNKAITQKLNWELKRPNVKGVVKKIIDNATNAIG